MGRVDRLAGQVQLDVWIPQVPVRRLSSRDWRALWELIVALRARRGAFR